MEDISINFDNLTRAEVLAKILDLGVIASISELRIQLKNLAKIHHPLHGYMNKLTEDEIKNLYFVLFSKKPVQNSERLRKTLSNEFFKNYPFAPLTAMVKCVITGKVPVPEEISEMSKQKDKKKEKMNKATNEKPQSPKDNELQNIMGRKRKMPSSGTRRYETEIRPDRPSHGSLIEEKIPFLGRKFLNKDNDCYVNSIMNFLMSSEEITNGVKEKVCKCTLCKNLAIFLDEPSKEHSSKQLKTYIAGLNPDTAVVFGGENLTKQQDAEEFLNHLIEKCGNLRGKTKFNTFKLRKCMNENCHYESDGSFEDNRTILTCHFNLEENALNITEEMVNNNESNNTMICENCKLMTEATGSRHEVKELFSSLPPKVFIMSVKRFVYDQLSNQGRKIGKAAYPSSTILLKNKTVEEQEFHLKSVVEHHGFSIAQGHYTSKLRLNDKWLVCNDTDKSVTRIDPLGGYLSLYEKTPLNVSQETLTKVLKDIKKSNQQEVDVNNDPPTTKSRPTFRNTSKEKPKEPLNTNKETESVQVDHLLRQELIKMLEDLGIVVNKKKSTADLRRGLKKKLELKNPIHEFLKNLEISALKDIVRKINMKYDQGHERMRENIATHFFEKYPCSPLTTLKNILNSKDVPDTCSEPKKRKVENSNPIVTYLRFMEDREIKEIVRKLGQNRLRNHNRIRSFIANYFFDIDNVLPLKVLQKFLDGELPELDVTLKKETTKRKSEGGSRPHANRAKTGLEEIRQNQEKLRDKRKSRLKAIAKKKIQVLSMVIIQLLKKD